MISKAVPANRCGEPQGRVGRFDGGIHKVLRDDVELVGRRQRLWHAGEGEIRATMRFLLERVKIVVEPSGAVAAAAVLFGMLPQEIESAGVVISGGNVDLDFLRTL